MRARNQYELQLLFEEQLCNFWRSDKFREWATGAGFMASRLGHPELRDMLKWLVLVWAMKTEEGE